MWFSWQPAISLTPAGWFLAAAMAPEHPCYPGPGKPCEPPRSLPLHSPCCSEAAPSPPFRFTDVACTHQVLRDGAGRTARRQTWGWGHHSWGCWGDTVGWARSRQHGNTLALLVAAAGRGPRLVLRAPAPSMGGSSVSSHFVRALNVIPKLRTGGAAEEAKKQIREQKGRKIQVNRISTSGEKKNKK